MDAGREYGMPKEPSVELVRLDLAEVPVDRVQNFLTSWAKRRVKTDDPGWQGRVRVGGPKYGVPYTSMPVSDSRSNLGVTLSFEGSPTDVVNVEVLHLSGGGSCVMVTRGVDGLAKLGGMGPQIASLVRHSEDQIKEKLERDLTDFSAEYHQRVLKGQAPAAVQYAQEEEEAGQEEGGDGQATVLSDGVIDVTPKERKKKAPAPPWKDGSVPPPMPRMEDAPLEEELPVRSPGAMEEPPASPDVKTLFDEVDSQKFNQAAFDLFETMEKGQKGEEEVAGVDSAAGFDNFFTKMRSNASSEAELMSLFEAGKDASRRGGTDQVSIPARTDLAQLEIMIGGDTGLRGGIDIFAGPPAPIGGKVGGSQAASSDGAGGERTKMPGGGDDDGSSSGPSVGTYTMYDEYGDPVLELTAQEMASLDEDKLTDAMASVDLLMSELLKCPKDIWNGITTEYSDLYLNPYYILAMRARIPKAGKEERDAMHAANQMAVNIVQEMASMHQRLEMQQLEKIRDICEAALDDMDSLPDKVRYMKPLLDDDFVAYMGYAIQKERDDVARSGLDPDKEPSRWLQVLGVIQKGVMAELEKSVSEDVLAISHILRMKEPEERFALLNVTIETLPSMFIRGFKKTTTNIVDYYRGMGDDCMDQDLRSMVLEIGEHLKVLMSDERMVHLCQEVDGWAAQKAKDDSVESKLRRVREYEGEDEQLRKQTASGLWNKNMRSSENLDYEDKAEMKKLTDAIREQNLLGVGDDDEEEEEEEEGQEGGEVGDFSDENELRRKLNRLSGPGGALESESRAAPHLLSPGGIAAGVAAARDSPDYQSLEKQAAEGAVDLSEVFSDVNGYARRAGEGGSRVVSTRDRSDEEETEGGEDEWGSFGDEDWRAPKGAGGVDDRESGGDGDRLRPRGAAKGVEVPGLLGGERFGTDSLEEDFPADEAGDVAEGTTGRGDGIVTEGATSAPR